MKKLTALLLCAAVLMTSFAFNISATNEKEPAPVIISFNLTGASDADVSGENNARVSGLITAYALCLEKDGTFLRIFGQTRAAPDVVRTGFKDLVIQRRATTSDSWKDYYDYGNLYIDMSGANLDTTLSVAAGYQYRISCKHYAKKNILMIQTIANTSNIVTVS